MEDKGVEKVLQNVDMMQAMGVPARIRLDAIRKISVSDERIDRFWEYLKANPTATPEEVAEEMDRLERTIPLTPEKAQMLREMEEEDMQ
ncbi:MAG: hypothetical protein SPI31_02230 [Eubacteriales bacterium]|nr:hypothetical protein [Eubacteriales bacterium]